MLSLDVGRLGARKSLKSSLPVYRAAAQVKQMQAPGLKSDSNVNT